MARPQVVVELNYGVGTAAPDALVLDSGRLDINLLDGGSGDEMILDEGMLDSARLASDAYSSGYWTDLVGFCEVVNVTRGRKRSLESFAGGRATVVLDNSDRRFDPTNLSGPYVTGSTSAIQPMRPVRVRAIHNGRSYPLFSGYADAWDIEWDDPSISVATLTASDAFKVLSDFDPLEVAPVGAGEDSGARVNRILDNAGFPATARNIDTGDSTLQATNLSSNAMTELKLVADSEQGSLYVDGEGKVTFKRRSARTSEAVSMACQVLFGDACETWASVGYGLGAYGSGIYGGAGSVPEVAYDDLAIAYDDDLIRNRASVARVGGTAQTVSDADSIARFQTHTFTRTDLIFEEDTEAADYARTIVTVHKDGDLRFDRLVVEPDGDDDEVWSYVLGLDIGHRICIRRRPPGGGLIERECFIEGIAHDTSAKGKWRSTFDLSNASTSGGLVLDHPSRGQLDNPANALTY